MVAGIRWDFWRGRVLPFVELGQVFHYGNPFVLGGEAQPLVPGVGLGWLFEPGLLPVSLDSKYWVPLSSVGDHFEFGRARPFRFLVVEETIDKLEPVIANRAQKAGLLVEGRLTTKAYQNAHLIPGCSPPGVLDPKRAALEVCLALLAQTDTEIDGLWWERLDPRISKAQRGGFFQSRLPLSVTRLFAPPTPLANPLRIWRRSKIF